MRNKTVAPTRKISVTTTPPVSDPAGKSPVSNEKLTNVTSLYLDARYGAGGDEALLRLRKAVAS